MRSSFVLFSSSHPGRKYRHEKPDIKVLLEKKESSYVDVAQVQAVCRALCSRQFCILNPSSALSSASFYGSSEQVYSWRSLKSFCDKEYPNKVFKSDNARKAFLLKKGLRLQKDEDGVEGVAIPKDDEKEIRLGKKLSASKIRQSDFGDGSEFGKDAIDQSHQKNSSGLTVSASSKASFQLPCRAVFVLA